MKKSTFNYAFFLVFARMDLITVSEQAGSEIIKNVLQSTGPRIGKVCKVQKSSKSKEDINCLKNIA